jgi:multidrug efflux system outer membrane protein
LAWQSFVEDERLRKVIEIALEQNRSLRETVANIESARAQYRIQRASLFPQVSADGAAERGRTTTGDIHSYSLEAGLSAFEIDLFGKQRSLSRAAFESYLATTAAGRATRLSLIAETATAYVTLAADTSQLAISRQTMESARRSMELTQKRLAVGVASAVDVKQAETIYQQARVDAQTLTATCAQDRNALELLAGTQLEDRLLPDELPAQNTWFAAVPAGLSSEVLLDRPDVLEAEHTLKAANANIGAARAAFFPSISLTASGGLASSDLSQLISKGMSVWSVAPTVTLPLFTGGTNTANLDYSQAQKSLYVSTYELTVQTAFKEVADALAVRGTIQGRLEAQGALVTAASDSYTLAEARYRKGVDTFLNALDSQRTLYSAQQTLISTRQTEMANVITLYQALGGGMGAAESAPAVPLAARE